MVQERFNTYHKAYVRKKKEKQFENKDIIAALRKEEAKKNTAKDKYEKAIAELKEFKKLREFIGGKTALNTHHHHHDHDDHLEGLEFDDNEGESKKKKGKRGDKSKKRGGKSGSKKKPDKGEKEKGMSSSPYSSSYPNKTGLNVKFLESAVTSQKSNGELDTTTLKLADSPTKFKNSKFSPGMGSLEHTQQDIDPTEEDSDGNEGKTGKKKKSKKSKKK